MNKIYIILFAVLITIQAKAHWERKKGVEPGEVKGFVAVDTLLFAATGGGVYKAADAGNSWQLSSTGLSQMNITCIQFDGLRLWVGTEFGGVRISHDNGLNWSGANEGLQDTLMIVQGFANDNKYLYFGTRGAGIFRRLLSEMNIVLPNALGETSSNKVSLLVYPNPANDMITVLQHDAVAAGSQYPIVDVTGPTISKGKLGFDRSISTSHLSTGIYHLLFRGREEKNQGTTFQVR